MCNVQCAIHKQEQEQEQCQAKKKKKKLIKEEHCCNPSFGFATKARACEDVGQKRT